MKRSVAWTPEGSVRGLGSVLIAMPLEELTAREHQDALMHRIDRLVLREDPPRARELLEVLEREERLIAPRNLRGIGLLLVDHSDRMAESMGTGFPVSKALIKHEPDTQHRLEEETLEEFLSALHPGEWD